jgi:arsenate reductase
VRIRLLQFEGCPNSAAARELLDRILAEEGVSQPVEVIEVVEVPDQPTAEKERFLGSPSIQIDGLDIDPARRADQASFACRMYVTAEGPSGVPAAEMIRAALRRARAPGRRLLFLCTGNSCRSQIAEGWARTLWGDLFEAHSAGTSPGGLDPRAVEVMREAGVDISGQSSKGVDEFRGTDFDCVVTLCSGAAEACPVFPAKTRVLHRGFDDPARLTGSETQVLAGFRTCRDEIRRFVLELPRELDLSEFVAGGVE